MLTCKQNIEAYPPPTPQHRVTSREKPAHRELDMITVLPSSICMAMEICRTTWSGSGCSVALSLEHSRRAGPTLYLTHADSLVTSTQDSVETKMPFIFAKIYGSTKTIPKYNFVAKITRFFFPFPRKLSGDPIFSKKQFREKLPKSHLIKIFHENGPFVAHVAEKVCLSSKN